MYGQRRGIPEDFHGNSLVGEEREGLSIFRNLTIRSVVSNSNIGDYQQAKRRVSFWLTVLEGLVPDILYPLV